MVLSQDTCGNLQKQDYRLVLRHSGRGEVSPVDRGGVCQPSGGHNPSIPTRPVRAVWACGGFPFPVGSELYRHRVWYVLVHHTHSSLFMDDAWVEVSAFFVIVWYLHPRNRALGFSAVMRTILTEATVYFFAMVAVHTYSIIGVKLLACSHHSVVIKYDYYRALITNRNFHICEYPVDNEGDGAALTYPLSREVRVDCALPDWLTRQSLIPCS